MARQRGFHVVVASDGSPDARAAVRLALEFPWPEGTVAHGVVGRSRPAAGLEWRPSIRTAIAEGLRRVAEATRRTLARRWPDARVVVVDRPPVEAILEHARAVGAGTIVVGRRGHGGVERLLLGSVSRGLVRRATCPVLVAKGRPRRVRRFLLGLDGSRGARRAVTYVAGLTPPRSGLVTLLAVVEPVRLASTALMPTAVRVTLGDEIARLNTERLAPARREVERAAAELKRAGWSVRGMVRFGRPLEELLITVGSAAAECLVLGARGAETGVERLLLGSVAGGALSRSPVPVLIVR